MSPDRVTTKSQENAALRLENTKLKAAAATVWMYYSTDGDSGYYNIRLFRTQESALAYKISLNDAYGNISSFKVWP